MYVTPPSDSDNIYKSYSRFLHFIHHMEAYTNYD